VRDAAQGDDLVAALGTRTAVLRSRAGHRVISGPDADPA